MMVFRSGGADDFDPPALEVFWWGRDLPLAAPALRGLEEKAGSDPGVEGGLTTCTRTQNRLPPRLELPVQGLQERERVRSEHPFRCMVPRLVPRPTAGFRSDHDRPHAREKFSPPRSHLPEEGAPEQSMFREYPEGRPAAGPTQSAAQESFTAHGHPRATRRQSGLDRHCGGSATVARGRSRPGARPGPWGDP